MAGGSITNRQPIGVKSVPERALHTSLALSGERTFGHVLRDFVLSTAGKSHYEHTRVEGWDFTFAPSPAGALPSDLFSGERRLDLNGEKIALKYYPPAHTDRDISIHFTNANIVHIADTFWNGYYPFIDYSTGGSIDGMIRATEANLSRITSKTIVIPGHGSVGDKSQLGFYRDQLVNTRDKVATLKSLGETLMKSSPLNPRPAGTTGGEGTS